MIFSSHFKCMTTQPGILPHDYNRLNFHLLAKPLQKALCAINDMLENEYSEKEIIRRREAYQDADEETKKKMTKLESLKEHRR